MKNSLLLLLLVMTIMSSARSAEAPIPSLAPALEARAGSEIMTPERLLQIAPLDLNNNSMIQWVDNKHFIYRISSVTPKQAVGINLYDIDSRTSELLTTGESPVPSPDGQWVAFVKGKGSAKQLWIINIKSKELKQISQIKKGLSGSYQYQYSYVWSPDSKKIILSRQDFMDMFVPKNEAKPKPLSEIDLINIATGTSKTLASIDASARFCSWLPMTDEVLFVQERIGAIYHEPGDSETITALNIHDGKMRSIIKIDGLQQLLFPKPSPNGKIIAVTYDAERPAFTCLLSIGILPANENQKSNPVSIQQITHDLQLKNLHWSQNNNYLFALRSYGPYGQIYKIDVATGHAAQLTTAALNIKTYDVSPDGAHLAWIGADAHGTYILRLASGEGKQVVDLLTQHSTSNYLALSEVREISWKTPDYPVPMHGLLIMPLHYKKEKRYPLLTYIHGGDVGCCLNSMLVGTMLYSTPLEWQFWAAKGYAVFVPEFRSSGAFGSLAFDRDLLKNHDRLGGDLNDIEAGVTYLINEGIADPNRLAIFGHSAGGNRSNWFEVKTHRYNVIVSAEGWADELELSLKLGSARSYFMHGGSPQKVPENYLKNSPFHFVEKATTPILFFMGNPELGGLDKCNTVLKFYKALKSRGIETEYHSYLDEGHVFEKAKNRKDILERTIEWIDRHTMRCTDKTVK